jgi:hypothetical protein
MLGEGAPLADVRIETAEVEAPAAARALDPAGVLGSIESGRAVVRVPLEPGSHAVRGTRFRVAPGTHLEVAVEVRDGEVVPTREGATGVRVVPEIRGPLWTTARGLYLERAGGGAGRLLIDVGGWMDHRLGGERGLELASFVESLRDPAADAHDPSALLRLGQASFRVDDARFAAGPLEVGGLSLELGEGNRLDVQGSLRSFSVEGNVRLAGGEISGEGLDVELGPSRVDLRVATEAGTPGDTRVTARATGLDAHAPALSARSGDGSELALRDARLRGEVEAIARLSGGARLEAGRVAFSGEVDAAVPSARFQIPDDDGRAEVRFSAERIQGELGAGGPELAVDGRLRGARLVVQDLEREGRLALERAHLAGDARLRVGEGDLSAAVRASSIDLELADYRSEDGAVDLGRTRVQGSGRAVVEGGDVRVEGDLHVDGAIDDLQLSLAEGRRFDVGRGSAVSGRLRRLEMPAQGDPVLEGRADVDLRLEAVGLELPGARLEGSGRMRGPASVRLGEGQLRLRDADARLELRARDGRLEARDQLDLDMATGSRADLRIRSATFGEDAPRVALGPGSELDLRLDGGHLRVAGRDVRFDAGARATFDIERLDVGADGLPEMVGALELDAPLDLDEAPEHLRVPHRPDIGGPSAAGARIEEVRLRADGSFDLSGVDVHLDTRVGDVEGARTAERRRLAPLLAARPELATHQDLINHFYDVGGGDWAGAERAARAYGVDLSGLVAERGAEAEDLLPDAPLDAAHARSELDIPSLAETRGQSVEALAGVEIRGAELDPWAVARSVVTGTLRFEVPLEGHFGAWPRSASFEPGTKLTLEAEVEDGELRELSAGLSKPGDTFLWTRLAGAYLDGDRNLRLNVAWGPDAVVPGFERLPRDMAQLAARLEGLGEGGVRAEAPSVLDLSGARLDIEGAEVEAGTTLHFPFGDFTVAGGTRLDARGGAEGLTVTGDLDLGRWALSTAGLAVDAQEASARARVEVQPRERGGWDARLVFEELDGALRDLAFEHGDNHIRLGAGDAEGRIEVRISEDAEGAQTVRGDVDLRRFAGEVRSARFVDGPSPDSQDPGRFELGATHLDGRIRVRPSGAVEVSGRAEGLQGALRNLTLATHDGPLHVEDARFEASAFVDYRPGQLVALDGALRGSAVLRADPEDLELGAGLLRDVRVEGGRAVVSFDLEGFDELSHGEDRALVVDALRGQLTGSGEARRVEGRLDPSAPRGPATAPPR